MLKGKIAVVTGASRGIGRAIAVKLAAEGAVVIINYNRSKDEAEKVKEQIEASGGQVKLIQCNVASFESCEKMFEEVMKEFGRIDILVNNAGVPSGGLMQMTSMNTLREVMEINFIAQIAIIQIVSKAMMRKKSGTIINMGSVGGIEAREGYLSYGSSKAAFLWATRSISKELAKYNIRVNAVAPGLIETDMGEYKNDAEREKVLNAISMKRMGKPEEVAKTVRFLASDDSSFMTGTILNVDGGRLV